MNEKTVTNDPIDEYPDNQEPTDPDFQGEDSVVDPLSGDPSAAEETQALNSDSTPDLNRELEESKDKYLRLYAEFDNYRRRAGRERQEAEQRGMADLLRGNLDILDDLSRFGQISPETTDTRTIIEGVVMVERKLLKSLGNSGLEVINPANEPFDPNLHEAIATTPAASEAEDNFVAQVYQVGYSFKGTLLRAARVVVLQWNE